MSLVAYGSSDDSDLSDNDEDNSIQNNVSSTVKIPAIVNKPSKKLEDQFSDSEDEIPTSSKTGGIDSILKDLPAPKPTGASVVDESDVLEDEVKPKPSQVADVEKPPPKKSRQPVKITIPALPDSDDEGEPAKKKPRAAPSSGRSGLTAMLPAPVHAAKKETGRILLPYSLTKKSQPNTANKPGSTVKPNSVSNDAIFNKTKPLASRIASYGSDSDDDNDNSDGRVNFFSIDNESSSVKSSNTSSMKSSVVSSSTSKVESTVFQNETVGPSLPTDTDSVPTVALPPTMMRTPLNLPAPAGPSLPSDNNYLASYSGDLEPVSCGPDPDAPLTFKGGVSSQRIYPSHTNSAISSSDQNMYYNMPYDSSIHYPESTDIEGYKQDAEFLRLQGKKQRGKEEINIIDVNADDYTDPSEVAKHLTEEETYQSHRKKDNQPSSQQKRKHQIHYLAFQAKERELDLKNQWAHNKQTKQQTQAKYGF